MSKQIKLSKVQTGVLEELLLTEIALNESRINYYNTKKEQVRRSYSRLNLEEEEIDGRIQEDYEYFQKAIKWSKLYITNRGCNVDVPMAEYLIETIDAKQSWNDELLRSNKEQETFSSRMFILMQNRVYFEITEAIYDLNITHHLINAKFQHELEI